MSCINKALADIKWEIPDEVLDIVFLPKTGYNGAPLSVDEYIKDKIIMKKVMVDCNIVGGRVSLIPLDGLKPIYTDPYTTVFEIPKNRTQGCNILSALAINYYPFSTMSGISSSTFNTAAYMNTSSVTSSAQRIADSVSSIPPISVAYCDLVGPNTIVVRDVYRVVYSFFLRCILENDANLNNINPRSWLAFSKLCVLACKSYIYTYSKIKMDKAYLYGGQELGSIKEIIDEYSDAQEQYDEYLSNKWRKISLMNDIHGYIRFIKNQINPAI